jgi:hypothetical protein
MKPHMKIEPYFRNNTIVPLARHEIGHYVIARVLGFETGSIKLKVLDFHGAHNGHSSSEPRRSLYSVDDVIKYSEDRIQVLFAGALAQSLSNGKIDDRAAVDVLEKGGGQNDFAKARELIRLIRNLRYPAVTYNADVQRGLDEINNDLWARTIALVEKDHHIICGLGDRISAELKYVGEEFELTEEELESLRSIRERFHSFEENKP